MLHLPDDDVTLDRESGFSIAAGTAAEIRAAADKMDQGDLGLDVARARAAELGIDIGEILARGERCTVVVMSFDAPTRFEWEYAVVGLNPDGTEGPPSPLSPTTRMVLIAISMHFRRPGKVECFASESRLAHMSGFTERAVRNSIREGKQFGFLGERLGRIAGMKRPGLIYEMTMPTPEPDSGVNAPTPERGAGVKAVDKCTRPRNVVPTTPERGDRRPRNVTTRRSIRTEIIKNEVSEPPVDKVAETAEAAEIQDRDIHPLENPKGNGHVNVNVNHVRQERPEGRWRMSDAGIEAKGRELGLWPARVGESSEAYEARLVAEIVRRRLAIPDA